MQITVTPSHQPGAHLLRRLALRGPGHGDDDPARLQRPRGRPGDARARGRPGPRPRRRDRPGHRSGRLHPGRWLFRRRLVHLPRHRRPRDRPGGDRHARRHPRAGLRRRGARGRPSASRCRCRSAARTRTATTSRCRSRTGRPRLAGRDRGRRGDLHAGRPATPARTRSRTGRATVSPSSAPATAAITITRRPSCDDVSRRTAVGAAVSVPLTCTDADGDPLTLAIDGVPSHGTLGSISGGAVTYTPDAGYSGADSFTYTRDRRHRRPRARRRSSITVTRAPSCADVARTTTVDHAVSVPLSCTDPDGRPADAVDRRRPGAGLARPISGGTVTYTPDAGASPATTRSPTARATAWRQSAPATVSITVTRAPACDDVSRRTARGRVGLGAADLHRSRRRPVHALDRGRPVEGLARA